MGQVSGYRLAGFSVLSLIRMKSGDYPGLQSHLRLMVYFKLNLGLNLVPCIGRTEAFSISRLPEAPCPVALSKAEQFEQ